MKLPVALVFGLAVGGMAASVPAAAADPEVFGTYTFDADDGEQATWTLTPCAGDPPGCVRVSETGNGKRVPWSSDAHYSVGSWIMFVDQPDAILCEDAPPIPGVNTYSWDNAAMTGNVSIVSRGACGTPASLSIPFRLSRIGAAPAPTAPPPATAPELAAPAAPAPAAPPPAAPAPAAPPPAPLAAESTAGAGAAPDTAPAEPPAG